MDRAFQLHRLWLFAFLGAMASLAVLAMLIGQGNPGNHMLVSVAIFVLFWMLAVVSYVRLAIAASRLARELGVWNRDVPLALLYAVGIGTPYSVWLDRKARQSRLNHGG